MRAVQRHQHQFSFLWSQMINNLRRWDLRAWKYANSSTLYRAWKSNSKIGHIFFYREWLTRPSRNVKNLEINKIGGASSFGNNTVGRTIDPWVRKSWHCRDSHTKFERKKKKERKKLKNFTREKERATKFVRRHWGTSEMYRGIHVMEYELQKLLFIYFIYYFSNHVNVSIIYLSS